MSAIQTLGDRRRSRAPRVTRSDWQWRAGPCCKRPSGPPPASPTQAPRLLLPPQRHGAGWWCPPAQRPPAGGPRQRKKAGVGAARQEGQTSCVPEMHPPTAWPTRSATGHHGSVLGFSQARLRRQAPSTRRLKARGALHTQVAPRHAEVTGALCVCAEPQAAAPPSPGSISRAAPGQQQRSRV